jgi:peptide/nickel transport system substrate-binding protein
MKTRFWTLGTPVTLALVFLAVGWLLLAPANADPEKERLIRKLTFIAYSPGQDKALAEAHKFIEGRLAQLGLQIDFKPMMRQGVLQNMWFNRNFDLGTLYLTGRPTRVDPNMILSKLYHSRDDAVGGYNWAGYHNKEYDETVDKSGAVLNEEERKKLVWKCQEIAGRDVPIVTMVHQMMVDAYNNAKWTGFVNMVGNGFKNNWTWTQIKPLTDNKVIVVGYSDDSGILNPLTAHEANVMVCGAVYDTLVKVGPDGSPKPWLAESWKWLSDTEIEFQLRKGHQWHDGKPLTAKDVKFTIDYIKEKKIAFHLDACEPIQEVKILDDHTIRFLLKHPYAPLLGYTGEQVFILPEHIWKDVPEKTNVENPMMWAPAVEGKFIGSGFLKFDYWRKNDEIKLVANKEHFFAPQYDARIFKYIPSAEASLGRFQQGELDMLVDYNGDPVALKKVCDANPKLTMHLEPSVGWYELAMNGRKPPLDDVVLRRAIAAIIPRDVLAKNVWKGYAVPAYSPIHPELKPWHNPNVTRWETQGMEGAKKMLKEAGYEWDSKGLLYYPKGKTN